MENILFEQHNIKLNNNREEKCISPISVARLKRNISYRRKFIKMLPLIKKEIECESNFIQSTERLIQHIVECNFDYLKKLIDSGVDINVKYNNWSLLHYACSMFDQKKYGSDEHLEIIRLLIDSGVPVNSQDEDRWTPLHLACQSGITRVISYLIRKGADIDACTIENLRSIDLVEPDNYVAISFLISASVNSKEKHV